MQLLRCVYGSKSPQPGPGSLYPGLVCPRGPPSPAAATAHPPQHPATRSTGPSRMPSDIPSDMPYHAMWARWPPCQNSHGNRHPTIALQVLAPCTAFNAEATALPQLGLRPQPSDEDARHHDSAAPSLPPGLAMHTAPCAPRFPFPAPLGARQLLLCRPPELSTGTAISYFVLVPPLALRTRPTRSVTVTANDASTLRRHPRSPMVGLLSPPIPPQVSAWALPQPLRSIYAPSPVGLPVPLPLRFRFHFAVPPSHQASVCPPGMTFGVPLSAPRRRPLVPFRRAPAPAPSLSRCLGSWPTPWPPATASSPRGTPIQLPAVPPAACSPWGARSAA